jgi:hypothetical protein
MSQQNEIRMGSVSDSVEIRSSPVLVGEADFGGSVE